MKNRKKQSNRKNRNRIKAAAAALVISGIGAGLFSMMTESAVQAGLNEVQEIPTSYQIPAAVSVPDIQEEAAADIREEAAPADYHVCMSSMNQGTPTSADLSMEEAAALGVRYLEEIMGVETEGMNVYMIYDSGTVTFPRAFWSGDVRFGEEVQTDDDTWSFFIDAVTGELFNIGCTETLDVDVPLGYDTSLETNYGVYAELARNTAERCNLVGGKVADVAYGSQGYSSNNPEITMEVTGENGQMAIISFSRYNQRLLGIIMDTSRRITDKALEDLMEGSYIDTEGCEEETLIAG